MNDTYRNQEPHASEPPESPLRASVRRDNIRGLKYGLDLKEERSWLDRIFAPRAPQFVREAGLTESQRAPYLAHRLKDDEIC